MYDVHPRLCGYEPGWNVPTNLKNVVFLLLGDPSWRLNLDAGANHAKERINHLEHGESFKSRKV
jgi:hypothetical protein